MQVKVNVNREDYWYLVRYSTFKDKKNSYMLIISMIFITLMPIIILYFLTKNLLFTIGVGLAIGILTDIYFFFSIKRKVLKLPNEETGIIGEHTYEVFEDGIKKTTSFGENTISWNEICDIYQTSKYIYISTSPAVSYIIPKRDFPQQNEIGLFFSEIRNKWENFKQAS